MLVFDNEKKIVLFNDFPVIHGFSTTKAGNMSYKYGGKKEVTKNILSLYWKLGIDMGNDVHIFPEFRTKILLVTDEVRGKTVNCDGLITTSSNISLSLSPADCLPILFTTRNIKLVGLIHGARKNLKIGIVRMAIEKLEKELAISPKEIIVAIGPGIKKCHYETDLLTLVIEQLKEVPRENIKIADFCTYCSRFKDGQYIFFSHQRAKETSEKEGRFIAVVALKPKSHPE